MSFVSGWARPWDILRGAPMPGSAQCFVCINSARPHGAPRGRSNRITNPICKSQALEAPKAHIVPQFDAGFISWQSLTRAQRRPFLPYLAAQ